MSLDRYITRCVLKEKQAKNYAQYNYLFLTFIPSSPQPFFSRKQGKSHQPITLPLVHLYIPSIKSYTPPLGNSGVKTRQVQPNGKASSSIFWSNSFLKSSACLVNVSPIPSNVFAIASCFCSRKFCCCSLALRRASHAASEARDLVGGLEAISSLLLLCMLEKMLVLIF